MKSRGLSKATVGAIFGVGLLLGGPMPGFGGVEVGAGGTAGAGFWATETGGGCASTRIVRTNAYTETIRGEAHVTVEPPGAPGMEIGATGGVYWNAVLDRSAEFELTEETGLWTTVATSSTFLDATRGWGGVVLGFHRKNIKSRIVLGLSGGTGRGPTPTLLPVADVEIAVGRLGIASYQLGWDYFPSGRDVVATEMSIFHGARLMGGDWPAFLIGVDLGVFSDKGVVPKFTMGFDAPRHWRVRPKLTTALYPPAEASSPASLNWRVDLGIDVVLGPQRVRHSELINPGDGG